MESNVIVLQSGDPNYIEASGTVAAVADYGKPLICSKVPKFQCDLQDEKDCIFVSPSSSAELVQVLVLLMKNSELRLRLGKNLRNKHKDNYWGIVAKEHVSLYNRLLINRSRETSR
jgi:glycosyltransferase involved in cell wall biosynthesis